MKPKNKSNTGWECPSKLIMKVFDVNIVTRDNLNLKFKSSSGID